MMGQVLIGNQGLEKPEGVSPELPPTQREQLEQSLQREAAIVLQRW